MGNVSAITQLDEKPTNQGPAWVINTHPPELTVAAWDAKHIFNPGVVYTEDDVETVTEETEGNDRIFRRLSYIVFFISHAFPSTQWLEFVTNAP
jgi:hypothetical protein